MTSKRDQDHSLNDAKKAKCSLVMTTTPCRVVACIISTSLRIHAPVHLLTYLLAQFAQGVQNRQYLWNGWR